MTGLRSVSTLCAPWATGFFALTKQSFVVVMLAVRLLQFVRTAAWSSKTGGSSESVLHFSFCLTQDVVCVAGPTFASLGKLRPSRRVVTSGSASEVTLGFRVQVTFRKAPPRIAPSPWWRGGSAQGTLKLGCQGHLTSGTASHGKLV